MAPDQEAAHPVADMVVDRPLGYQASTLVEVG